MPVVDVEAELLFERLGKRYTEDEFQLLCFEFGLELDDVTSEKEKITKEQGADKAVGASEAVIYKIDIPANRYDLLCLEGISKSLNVFLEREEHARFKLTEPQGRLTLKISPETKDVRPHCVAAVLRNVTFDKTRYDSFISLQEKLHFNICRKRSLVAIGTHDLDTIHGPFVYSAEKPSDIKFKPLRAPDMTKEYTAAELMEVYKEDPQLKEYLHIIENKPLYPVIRDSKGTILSFPPIINGDHSKITLDTKNVFIECTATDLTKAKIVLNMMVCMFSGYCEEPCTVEPVDVYQPDGTVITYPDLESRIVPVSAELLNRRIGINCASHKLASLLTRMQLPATVRADGNMMDVEVPPVRPDIIHECDIWEDAAIGFGYNNIEKIAPQVCTEGAEQPVNKLTDQLRAVIAQAGFKEVLTFALCSHADGFANLRREDDKATACILDNPAHMEFEIARVNLLSSLLKTIVANRSKPLPIRIFEIADVILLDPKSEVGAVNKRRIGALIYSRSPGFEEIQSLLHYIMKMLGVPFVSKNDSKEKRNKGYYLQESQDPAFFGELAAADVICYGKRLGVVGIVHPEVLAKYDLKNPCGALELEIEEFV
eukprot:m.11255 g.11255  ORF g.11255 m.11255 type:complete len:600 (+) comp4407_c0_seq1:107-1906(+)